MVIFSAELLPHHPFLRKNLESCDKPNEKDSSKQEPEISERNGQACYDDGHPDIHRIAGETEYSGGDYRGCAVNMDRIDRGFGFSKR